MIVKFNLDSAGDFLGFAQFKGFNDIGLKDNRKPGQIKFVPF